MLAANSVGRLLAQIGITCQKPLHRAIERDESLVRQWLKKEYPKIKAMAKKTRGGHLFRRRGAHPLRSSRGADMGGERRHAHRPSDGRSPWHESDFGGHLARPPAVHDHRQGQRQRRCLHRIPETPVRNCACSFCRLMRQTATPTSWSGSISKRIPSVAWRSPVRKISRRRFAARCVICKMTLAKSSPSFKSPHSNTPRDSEPTYGRINTGSRAEIFRFSRWRGAKSEDCFCSIATIWAASRRAAPTRSSTYSSQPVARADRRISRARIRLDASLLATALLFKPGKFSCRPPKLVLEGTGTIASGQDKGFFTAVSTNGTQAYSGIIWAVGRPSTSTVITLSAFDATAVGGTLNLIFSSPAGSWTHTNGNANIVPVTANGLVYVASDTALTIFGVVPAHAAAPQTAQTAVQPSPVASLASPHEITGTLLAISGSTLTLQTRTGKSAKIADSQAVQNEQVAPLFVGQPFTALGSSFDANGALVATSNVQAKGSSGELWPPDF